MKDLKITLVQSELTWENAKLNLDHFGKLLKNTRKNSTDLIILPEMFSTGFTMNAATVAEPMNGISVQWMKELAAVKNAVVCGSLIISVKGKYFNRLIWAEPDGNIDYYDKRHLFRLASEHETFTGGNKKLFVNLKGWKICPLVCYDLRFPVWSRTDGSVDLVIYIANWPERRAYAWNQLLIARAIENQCYVTGLNRVGIDGNENTYAGDSVVLDPLGMLLSKMASLQKTETVSLKYKVLAELRKDFPVSLDADKFSIKK